jgi:hypothetical protein
MTYHSLSDSTLTPDERLAEAGRILKILDSEPMDHFTQREQDFIAQIGDAQFVSVKQIFYLRDLLQKVQ